MYRRLWSAWEIEMNADVDCSIIGDVGSVSRHPLVQLSSSVLFFTLSACNQVDDILPVEVLRKWFAGLKCWHVLHLGWSQVCGQVWTDCKGGSFPAET